MGVQLMGVQWVKARDFRMVGELNWVFSGKARGPKGTLRAVHLVTAHRLPIKRHTKITGKANPYDPTWALSLEKRLALKMTDSRQGRRTWLDLWRRQEGRWAHGGEAMTTRTGWHSHHTVWRSHGGSDTADNRVLRHPTCHRQVHHALGSTRMPPPVTRGFGKA
jgi:RNA-directed DNA polymerase